MAQKSIKGVGGVLGGLISEPVPSAEPTISSQGSPLESTESPEQPLPSRRKQPAIRSARRGRPPGRKSGEATVKEKVSLSLDTGLMAEYRDWSWDARCHLGELVERALTHYLKQRSRSQKT